MRLGKFFLLSVCTYSLSVEGTSQLYGAEMIASSMFRRFTSSVIVRPIVISALGCRYHSTLQNSQPGFYTQATEDPIFKLLMKDDEVRNSFLTGVIGEPVIASDLLDNTLNPMRSYTGLRDLLNSNVL
jgi:hypothetical protein